MANLGQLTRDIFALLTRKRRVNPSYKSFQIVERSLFAIIDLLQGTKSLFLYFKWREVLGMLFKKNSNLRRKKILFHFFSFNFLNVITAAP